MSPSKQRWSLLAHRGSRYQISRTRLQQIQAEHAVDMETGAVVAVTVQPADTGDTRTMEETLGQASEHIQLVAELIPGETGAATVPPEGPTELVTDKGYHSREAVRQLAEAGIHSYISEPERGRQRWHEITSRSACVRLLLRRAVAGALHDA